MTSQVIYVENALTQFRRVEVVEPSSIRSLAPSWNLPYIALVDGEPVLRADWELVIEDGQSVVFLDVHCIPQGGGNGGSNPLRTILMLAVMVYAPTLAGQLSYAMGGGTFLGSVAGLNLLQAGVTIAGMTLINAVLPPPKPLSTNNIPTPSPTYSLQAQGNSVRLEAPIPEQFGRLKSYPDFAAQPYIEYEGNEQYLYQLLSLGRGEYTIEAINIEDTPIASFTDVTQEVVPPGGSITLFPANVTTSGEVSGQELKCAVGSYSQSGNSLTVTLEGHGLGIGAEVYLEFTSGTATNGDYTVISTTADTFTITRSSATTSGSVTVSPWVGGFIANNSGTQANALGVDLIAPRGLFNANSNGNLESMSVSHVIEARQVDASGTPITSYVQIAGATRSGATTTPQRYSLRVAVTLGRYQVRARRADIEETNSRYGHNLVWGGLRAYLPETRDFGDVTLIAMRLRASNNLSMQASRKVNVIATRKLPVWNGIAWSGLTSTRSISWALAYACKQAGLTDAQIDLPALLTLDATWTSRGDTFDGRFDNFLTFWEAASKIAGAGRAKIYMQSGVIRVVRDQSAAVPVALFSQRNIVKNSLAVNYLMPTAETADSVQVAYFDEVTWAPAKVLATLNGDTADQPAKIDLFGVVKRTQAYREGLYQSACNKYRRKVIKFSTEMEGFIPSFGDLIAIQHDMPAWGQGGEVVGWNTVAKTATVSEPLTWVGGTHYVAFRKRDGSVDGPYSVTQGANAYEVVLSISPSVTPYTGSGEERTHIAFGASETWRQPARVVAVRPQSLTQVEIEAVNEDPSVHTAESGMTAPPMTTSQLVGSVTAPTLSGLVASSLPYQPDRMVVSWKPSPWADHYLVEQSGDGTTWTRVGSATDTSLTAIVLYGSNTQVRVAAVNSAVGPWAVVALNASVAVVSDGLVIKNSAGEAVFKAGDVDGSAGMPVGSTFGALNDNVLYINADLEDIKSFLRFGRTTGGIADINWDGQFLRSNVTFFPNQLNLNNTISATEPLATFPGQIWVDPN